MGRDGRTTTFDVGSAEGRPGAMSTAILLHNQATNLAQRVALYGCILAVALASYLIFRISATGAKWLSPIAMNITARIMGLLLSAVAIQFAVNAVKSLWGDPPLGP